MIRAGRTELTKAFRTHGRLAKAGSTSSHLLLLFYAVECGLKALYLHNNGLLTTNDIPDERLQGSHDLWQYVVALRLGAHLASPPPQFHLERDGARSVHTYGVVRAHQVWRYGISIRARDRQGLVGWLSKLRDYLKDEL